MYPDTLILYKADDENPKESWATLDKKGISKQVSNYIGGK
jgi:hypothetical protein